MSGTGFIIPGMAIRNTPAIDVSAAIDEWADEVAPMARRDVLDDPAGVVVAIILGVDGFHDALRDAGIEPDNTIAVSMIAGLMERVPGLDRAFAMAARKHRAIARLLPSLRRALHAWHHGPRHRVIYRNAAPATCHHRRRRTRAHRDRGPPSCDQDDDHLRVPAPVVGRPASRRARTRFTDPWVGTRREPRRTPPPHRPPEGAAWGTR